MSNPESITYPDYNRPWKHLVPKDPRQDRFMDRYTGLSTQMVMKEWRRRTKLTIKDFDLKWCWAFLKEQVACLDNAHSVRNFRIETPLMDCFSRSTCERWEAIAVLVCLDLGIPPTTAK